jgi:hypothetical protein
MMTGEIRIYGVALLKIARLPLGLAMREPDQKFFESEMLAISFTFWLGNCWADKIEPGYSTPSSTLIQRINPEVKILLF